MVNGNDIYEMTMQNLRAYTERRGLPFYEKRAGSTKGGFWKEDDIVMNLRLVCLDSEDELDFCVFEAYPGITVSPASFAVVSEYCLRCGADNFTCLQVAKENGDVTCQAAIPIAEHPIDTDTIDLICGQIRAKLSRHRRALEALAHGRLASCPPEEEPQGEMPVRPLDEELETIRNYLVYDSKHNAIAERIDENGMPEWIVEIYCEEDHYSILFHVDPSGILDASLRQGLRGVCVKEEFAQLAAEYLMESESCRKVGFFRLGDEEESACVCLQASLLAGPIGRKTLHMLEAILVNMAEGVWKRLELICAGVSKLPGTPRDLDEEEKKGGSDADDDMSGLESFLEDMMRRKAMAEEDDDDDEEFDPGENAIDADFLRGLLTQSDTADSAV